ncbi:MAG TPA: hypothetical protein VIU15_12610, partial [Streptomyces sp.]
MPYDPPSADAYATAPLLNCLLREIATPTAAPGVHRLPSGRLLRVHGTRRPRDPELIEDPRPGAAQPGSGGSGSAVLAAPASEDLRGAEPAASDPVGSGGLGTAASAEGFRGLGSAASGPVGPAAPDSDDPHTQA